MGKMESKSLIYSLFEDNYVQIIILDVSFRVEERYNPSQQRSYSLLGGRGMRYQIFDPRKDEMREESGQVQVWR